jgi:type I restriction enzyme S subunit
VSWKTVELGNLCEVLDNRRKPVTKCDRIKGEFPYYGATGIVDYVDNYIFDEKLVLVGEDGAKWESGEKTAFIVNGKYWVNNHAHVIKPKRDLLLDEWLVYYFFYKDLKEFITGLTVPKLNMGQLKIIPIPLPPLPIQQKIVIKLDKIFAEIDKASATVEANIKNAKLYIGKLSDEAIHEKLEKYKELTLNDITEVITCGVAKRPEYVESGIPFLSARNVKNGKMKWDRYEFVSEETHNTLSKHNKPKIGDILYSRVGAGFGDAAIIDKDIEFSIFVSLTLLKVKPVVLNEFLCYYLNSPFIKEVARKNITGTGVGNLNVGAVRLFKIKLPDLKIQNEIVKKLYYINQNGKILIESYLKKLEQLSLLKQSILKQAFNGELVKAA